MNNIKTILKDHDHLKELLFIRGFLLTDREDIPDGGYPFFGSWKFEKHGMYSFWTHPKTGIHVVEQEDRFFFLLGHAYNPFTMEIDENAILGRIAEHYGKPDYYDYIDELTGVFIYGVIGEAGVEFLVDPSGMQSAAAGTVGGYFYLTSHPQLVADLCNLKMDPFAQELAAYKWYPRVMGCYLPGDMTPYKELKRVVPDISYVYDSSSKRISHRRFYPLKPLKECTDDEEYKQVIRNGADILHCNMELVGRKWDCPAISLTGGIDSNTTFAAANGLYDKFKAFSFISAKKESIDAEAAKRIANHFHVEYRQYPIPETTEDIADYDEIVKIIEHNNGYVVKRFNNEYRKRVYLYHNLNVEVEVKSWVSEAIRAYWYKHYGRKSMPKLSPKLYRNLYKIFLSNRRLAHKVDHVFADYIQKYGYDTIPDGYLPADMHHTEMMLGSWGGTNISEMKLYADIVIPYNNRRFIDLLLRAPLDKRINDQHHLDMKKYLNSELYDMGIRVVNLKETRTRAFLLNIIFAMNMMLPF